MQNLPWILRKAFEFLSKLNTRFHLHGRLMKLWGLLKAACNTTWVAAIQVLKGLLGKQTPLESPERGLLLIKYYKMQNQKRGNMELDRILQFWGIADILQYLNVLRNDALLFEDQKNWSVS